MGNFIDIKQLGLDELMGVISAYPWYGGARKELCVRMSQLGGELSAEEYANAALYIPDRRKIVCLMNHGAAMADEKLAQIIKSYIAHRPSDESGAAAQNERKIHVVGGDYFTQSDYDRVKKADDNVFLNFKPVSGEKLNEKLEQIDIYTETLAQIYAEQGYYEQAKAIYSKLILAYPEKNAYFASLIEKLGGE